MSRRALVAVLPVVALTVAACGSNVYDPAAIEKQLRDSQLDKVRGLPVGKATCPKDVKLTEGVTFRCTLVVNGVPAPYRVTITKVDQDPVHVALEPAKALIPPPVVAAFVKSKITPAALRRRARVTCGKDRLFVVDPGTRIGCIVTIDGREQQVSLRVRDTTGYVVLERPDS